MKSSFSANLFALFLFCLMFAVKNIFGEVLLTLPLSPVALNSITAFCVYVIAITLYFYISKNHIRDTLFINPISFGNFFLIFFISVTIQPLLMLISGISSFAFQNNVTLVFETFSTIPLWQLLIMSSLIPAFMEEVCFRGIVFSNYRNISFKKSAAATAFIFAMAHMDGQQFLYAFFMGIVFAYFVYKTGSVFASMFSHFTINSIQTWLAHTLYSKMDVSSAQITKESSLESLFAIAKLTFYMLPVVIFLFYVFHVKNSKDKVVFTEKDLDFTNDNKNEKIFNLPLIIYIIFFINSIFSFGNIFIN